MFSELGSFQNGALSPVSPPTELPGTPSPSSAGGASSLMSDQVLPKCKEDMNISPRSSTPRVNFSFFPSWLPTPINLWGAGRFGRKDDKEKDSEKMMPSEVVDSSTIQDDTQERVYFSKLFLI